MATKYIGNTKVGEVVYQQPTNKCPLALSQNVIPQASVGAIDLSWTDLSYTTSLSRGFYYHRSITSVNFGEQDFSNVTNAANCFIGCENLESVYGASKLICSSCSDIQYIFYDCAKLKLLDVSKWDTSNVTTFTQCFRNCKSLQSLDLRSWDLTSATGYNLFFNNTPALTSIRVGEGWVKGIDFSSTGLQHDGILQLFNDLPTISDAQTMTLGSTKLGYMSDDEKAIAQNKGWTLA